MKRHTLILALLITVLLMFMGCTDNPDKTIIIPDGDTVESDEVVDGDDEGIIDGDGEEAVVDGDAEVDGDIEEDIPAEEEQVEIVDHPQTGWDGVTITSINAPDETTVKIVFSRDPGEADCLSSYNYIFTSEAEQFDIENIAYDAATATVTITTSMQKLGIEYTLTMLKGDNPTGTFLTADTKKFWVSDMSSSNYDQYQVTAHRVAVSDTSVAYVEEGYTFPGVDQIMGEFDDMIYPTETTIFHPAPDKDGNGRIVMLGLDGGDDYGGYFSPINAMADNQTMSWWGLHSNEMEMIHINVLVDVESVGHVIAHEFQHLLYNSRHGMNQEYWEYHDEGLAESAVRVVYGSNDYAVDFYQWDYQGKIAQGVSMVNWTYAQYENYALAYMWWAYVAGQLDDGMDGYSAIFDMNIGSPDEVDAFTTNNFGMDFPSMYMNNLIANWVQEDSGAYSYNGTLSFPTSSAPTVGQGTQSVDIGPFTGTFFRLNDETISYPGTQGSNIVYAGIDPEGNIDLEEPFTVDGGALLVYNKTIDYDSGNQHSGPDVASTAKATGTKSIAPMCSFKALKTWMNPPPVNPDNLQNLHAWQKATAKRLAQ